MSTWWEMRPHQLSFPWFYLVLHVVAPVVVHVVVPVVVQVVVVHVVLLVRPALLVYSESPDLLHAVVVALRAPRFTPCTMWWTRNSGAF